ncbi:MAG: hypothetical protein Q7S99_00510 [Parvibaculum sp.]|nr:hypothetical protein [Parvibaculum sp.]|tara:strand:+ start:1270 stop:2157 length:888 start_codon:yes stop_codon:yes gene_type:complete
MLAVYDLAVSPPTYDFIGFLVTAERQRIRWGEKSITFVIVGGPKNGFREDNLPPHDPEVRRKMLDNIVKPMCTLLPTCDSVLEIPRTELADVLAQHTRIFPMGYDALSPKPAYGTKFFVKASRAQVLPLMVNDVQKEKGLIVITLRQSHYWPTRNSDVAEWLKVARALIDQGKRVVFVPDTESDGSELEGFDVDRLASTDITHRARLAAQAELNLSVNNGPIWMLSMMPQVSIMAFRMVAADAPAVSPAYFASQGLPVGSQLDRPNHKIIWQDDTAEVILAAIDEGFPDTKRKAA